MKDLVRGTYMAHEPPPTADTLRKQFKDIPQEQRDGHQAYSVRVWRGLSWLERSETAADMEGRFISLWIAFNAVYGYLQDDGLSAPDHATWQAFLAAIAKADTAGHLARILWDRQVDALRLIDSKYQFRPFWLGHPDAEEKLKRSRRQAIMHFNDRSVVGVLEELFERLYVLRQQVFHGAATASSKLNRRAMKLGASILAAVIPAIIDIMITVGPEAEWGEVCFPPVSDR